MPAHLDLAGRAAALSAEGTPFVWATVVHAHRPTSAKAGDSAIVLADGQIDGFVGGECAEATVRAQSLEALSTGQTRLLRVAPGEEETGLPDEDGVITVHNPCLSGGTLEILLEPSVPLPVVAVVGSAPIATALLRADRLFGLQVRALTPEEELPDGTLAVVVASHGRDEEPVLTAALRAGVPYVGLVASRRRGAAVLASLDVEDAQRDTVHTPAGLDIGARTADEVALSILAEVVATRRAAGPAGAARTEAAATPPAPATAKDPVCGMTVAAVPTSVHVDTPAGTVWFCGTGCRTAYLDNPAAYAT
ncbi:XdhC family protein [Oryzihumus leptocrescens]|uniref:Xanthine dehydrogenase accessory factor n=1 Tax=Oryzihumus leptocrescens TaxID=297536 RepID=A0A542ZGE3_9MICO|nr:XdhC family protein [Oryzihumus leptocrescens]TQL59413.1 xanthine dehydrogenase accessory factor [Oryzihumus leptocrescens]